MAELSGEFIEKFQIVERIMTVNQTDLRPWPYQELYKNWRNILMNVMVLGQIVFTQEKIERSAVNSTFFILNDEEKDAIMDFLDQAYVDMVKAVLSSKKPNQQVVILDSSPTSKYRGGFVMEWTENTVKVDFRDGSGLCDIVDLIHVKPILQRS